jgi:hypothetical protein
VPNWKKLILSGSDSALNSLNVTTSVTAASFTGSFSGSVAAPGSTTQVVFNNGGILSANSGFVYSGSNVGIGTTSPNSRLVVQGSGTTSATSALNVTNSATTNILFVRNDGNVGINNTSPTGQLDIQGVSTKPPLIIRQDGTGAPPLLTFSGNYAGWVFENADAGGRKYQIATTRNASSIGGGRFIISDITSIDRPGGNTSSSGDVRLCILGTGEVGIGTTTPLTQFHVRAIGPNNSANTALIIQKESSTSDMVSGMGTNMDFYLTDANTNIDLLQNPQARIQLIQDYPTHGGSDEASGDLAFYTALGTTLNTNTLNEVLRLTRDGRVGVGVSKPAFQLQVNNPTGVLTDSSPMNAYGIGIFQTGVESGQGSGIAFTIYGSGNINEDRPPGGAIVFERTGTNSVGDLIFKTRSGIGNTDPTSERWRITSTGILQSLGAQTIRTSTGNLTLATNGGNGNILLTPNGTGNVGIGTISPTSKLYTIGEIVGGTTGFTSGMIGFTGLGSYNSSTLVESIDGLYIRKGGGDGSSVSISLGNAAGNNYFVGARIKHIRTGSNSNGHLVFETKSDSSNNTTVERMRITDNGNIGIGTTTPSQKLDVQGNIAITKALLSNQENLDVDSGATRVIATISSTSYDAAFFDFVIKKGTNLRAGTLYAVHNGTTTEFTETSTQDLGNTSDVTLSADLSGGNIRLLATTLTNDWIIKTLVRGI